MKPTWDPELADPGSEEERLLQAIDPERLPRHVAIIMDGNGRWARQRRMPRVAGHRAGVRAVREIVEVAARMRIGMVTLYAFSSENWKRPPAEVTTLMTLLREFLNAELDSLVRNNIRLCVIGRLCDLQERVRQDVERALAASSRNDGMKLCIALSYGGRTEIVDACRSVLQSGLAPEKLTAEEFARHLYTADHPDPDLLIRTSGELRVSNFLLWQIAYAEIWVTETLWPDFGARDLFRALIDYQRRERRYGGLSREGRERPATALGG